MRYSKPKFAGTSEIKVQRLLDPPLIIEVNFISPMSELELSKICQTIICTVTLLQQGSPADTFSLIPSDKEKIENFQLSNLVGVKSATASLLFDDESQGRQRKIFFVMPQLSIRLQGEYQLSCEICNVKEYVSLVDLSPEFVVKVVTSPFTVYPPQSYPGSLRNEFGLTFSSLKNIQILLSPGSKHTRWDSFLQSLVWLQC